MKLLDKMKKKPKALTFGFNKAGIEKFRRSVNPSMKIFIGVVLIIMSFLFGFIFLFISKLVGIGIFFRDLSYT